MRFEKGELGCEEEMMGEEWGTGLKLETCPASLIDVTGVRSVVA